MMLIVDDLVSSSKSPVELVPTPAEAATPLRKEGKKNAFVPSIGAFCCLAVTLTLPSTLAVPSSHALVVPFSWLIATESPTIPSAPEVDRASVRLRSIVSAWTNRSPPTSSTA